MQSAIRRSTASELAAGAVVTKPAIPHILSVYFVPRIGAENGAWTALPGHRFSTNS